MVLNDAEKELSIEVLLVQLLVLAFTGALWWIARRDLAARVPPPALTAEPADTAELEQLCATLETLVTNLARRLDTVERQIAAPSPAPEPAVWDAAEAPAEIRQLEIKPVQKEYAEMETLEAAPPSFGPRGHLDQKEPTPAEPEPDPRLAPVYALLEAGVFDPVEIARQTGLGRGEVDLILSLRDRRAF